jgi:hypothetical protein
VRDDLVAQVCLRGEAQLRGGHALAGLQLQVSVLEVVNMHLQASPQTHHRTVRPRSRKRFVVAPHLNIASDCAGGAVHGQRPGGRPPTTPEVLQAGLLAAHSHDKRVLVLSVHAAGGCFARIVRGDVVAHSGLQRAAHYFLRVKLGRRGQRCL